MIDTPNLSARETLVTSRFGERCVVLPTLALVLLSGCGPAPPKESSEASRNPHIVLVTLDTTRADRCSAYGHDTPTTPFLESIASSGALFEAAYAPMATTGPSHTSLFTSMYPRSHGFVKNGLLMPSGRPTMAETLHDHGYRTAAFVSAFPVSARFGFGRGFDVFDESFGESDDPPQMWEGVAAPRVFERPGVESAQLAATWLASRQAESLPVFLWVHVFDPHFPYEPNADHLSAIIGPSDSWPAEIPFSTRYDAELRAADDAVRLVFEAIARFGNHRPVIRIVVGDHGEGLLDHGHMEHGIQLYEEAVRVPLVMSYPEAIPPGLRFSEPVEILDVLPTVLELAGIPRPDGYQGRSLVSSLIGQSPLPADRAIFLQRRRYQETTISGFHIKGELTAVRRGTWKLLSAPDEGWVALYDLENDPGETTDLSGERPDIRSRLTDSLHEWAIGHPAAPTDLPEVDPEVQEALRALGYLH